MAAILIIDDDQGIQGLLGQVVQKAGHTPLHAKTIQEGFDILRKQAVDVAILDVHLPDGNGIDVLPDIRRTADRPEVIINTGFGEPNGAELAIKNGAWDYFVKPESTAKINLTLKRVLEFRREKWNNRQPQPLKRDAVVGSSVALNQVLERVAFAATGDASVLITGETGTGKELFARAIHENSRRVDRPFVVVDCASLPGSLLESILFGHQKGAFTGADRDRRGLVKQADGGTLFLDEIGELDLPAQKKFLRFIQERRYRSVSGPREERVDFRLISATNRDLADMVGQGAFRRDLLYRVSTFPLDTPPLRDRNGDVEELAQFHLNRLCARYGKDGKKLSPEFLEALKTYRWPGNIRELFNTLEEVLAVTADEPVLYAYHLPTHMRAALARDSVRSSLEKGPAGDDAAVDLSTLNADRFPLFKSFRLHMERRYLMRLLELSSGRRKAACNLSGLSRTRLFELLKKHELN